MLMKQYCCPAGSDAVCFDDSGSMTGYAPSQDQVICLMVTVIGPFSLKE